MKCERCLNALKMDHGDPSGDGFWCLKFKGVPSRAMALKCREFVDRRLVYDH